MATNSYKQAIKPHKVDSGVRASQFSQSPDLYN